jgi:F0F1-type ATP synthase membrane subunit c/vacuolar-type H+-ATPase subunit K
MFVRVEINVVEMALAEQLAREPELQPAMFGDFLLATFLISRVY